VIGNPSRQVGWMSEYGQKLFLMKKEKPSCPESQEKYKLEKRKG
jgi:UDP-2-acetamido-3-amino-2,3-dideoxy-glucuronate N-acetyltransferase